MGANNRYEHLLTNRPHGKSVQVYLPALFPQAGAAAIDGLDLTRWAPGALQSWLRSTDGSWIGVVTILIPKTTGGSFRAEHQLVPVEAMRPE